MAATSLKLPENLKRRIARLASTAGKSPHAFMVEALTREAEQSELRQRFATDSALSEKEATASGKAYSLAPTFDYLDKRASGGNLRRPRAHAWRASK